MKTKNKKSIIKDRVIVISVVEFDDGTGDIKINYGSIGVEQAMGILGLCLDKYKKLIKTS